MGWQITSQSNPRYDSMQGIQSVFEPRSIQADAILALSNWVFAAGSLIFVLVMALLAWAIISRRRHPPLRNTVFIAIGGFAFPAVTLSILMVFTVLVSLHITSPAGENAVRIHVTGHMWWWEVQYEGPDGERIETANELHLPIDRPVSITVTSEDVIHSFWIPSLAGKVDMIPGHVNEITFTPTEAGVMRGQCAEYCGLQHAKMAFYVVVEPAEQFDQWLEEQAQPAVEPVPDLLKAGQQAFVDQGCGSCHAVRGLPGAVGQIGPDLTHVGSRLSIGAGWLDGSVGNLAGWIASSQHIKPGNRMPSFDRLDGKTLRALAAWLESLE
ncbi:cytochrome c oxidase subunit II [Chelativorans sp. YIM 93263]|uniref:cytochrome c oxidase subunit II n=1 Tax=Chelativorans sp. YIM 93263 TaxID=2906648 RepID=UPI0023785758|nr:cytochrome c oxidase subunit II [Chelativorans sp. YIM 93263]